MKFKDFRKNLTYKLFAPHLEEEEKIFFIAHRHPFLMIKLSAKIIFFGFFIPIFLWYMFPEIWFIFLIWVLWGVIELNKMVFNWYFDAILVTNLSLIDVKWNGPFDRTSDRLQYTMIEGTSYAFRGLIQTFFNYGNIKVNRQGGEVGISLDDAIHPARLESVIIKTQEKFLESKNLQDVRALKNLLGDMLTRHANDVKEIEIDF
ncbi:MAG: hypothetical protein ACRCZE_00825 [Candidatus Altimarinota bacterium]